MRKAFPVSLAASGRWGPNDAGGNLRPYNWILIDNRSSANDVVYAPKANPANDAMDYHRLIKAGTCRVFNLAPPKGQSDGGDTWSSEVHLLNLGTSATPLWVEISDHPIVDFSQASLAQVSVISFPLISGEDQAHNVMVTEIADGVGHTNRAAVSSGDPGDGQTQGNSLSAMNFPRLWDPVAATWSRQAGGGGSPVSLLNNGTISNAGQTSTVLGGTQTHPGGQVRGCYVSVTWGGITGTNPTLALAFEVLGADGATWVTYGAAGAASSALTNVAAAASASIYPAANFTGVGAAGVANAVSLAESAIVQITRGLPHQFRVVAILAVNPSSLTAAYAQLHWLT